MVQNVQNHEKIKTIKSVRELTGMGLMESKAFVEKHFFAYRPDSVVPVTYHDNFRIAYDLEREREEDRRADEEDTRCRNLRLSLRGSIER